MYSLSIWCPSRNHNNRTKCCAVLPVQDWVKAKLKWTRDQTPIWLTLNLSFMMQICCRPLSVRALERSSPRWWYSHTMVQEFRSMWESGGGVQQRKWNHLQSATSAAELKMRWCCTELTVLVCIRYIALFALLGVSFSEHLLCGTRQQAVICQFDFKPSSPSSCHTSVCPTCCCVSASVSPAGVPL